LKVVILDLFGGSGGVGRCTREILRQLAMENVPAMLAGQSHVVDSFRNGWKLPADLRLANLEQPKFSLKSLKIKFAARCKSSSSQLANVLLEETIKAAGHENSLPVLVNYPQVIAPPTRREKFSVLLHDLNWRLYPGNFQEPELADRNCRGWVERAAKIITNSECTRNEVIERYGCDPRKVIAAPLAPFADGTGENFDAAGYLASLGLVAGRFHLFPGVFGLHKGQDVLTEAIEISQAADPVVVTCGRPLDGIDGSTNALAAMRRALASRWDKLVTQKKLVVVSGVPEPKMRALRNGCRAYVLPSQYEGYGFPLAEAVWHHRPAIVSDITAHREILNRYPQYKLATLFPPGAAEALAEKLNQDASNPIPKPADWQKQIETAWSWKNTVQKILSTLDSAVA
jgi:glycosyltransferase involved in cell wall biosynthesis